MMWGLHRRAAILLSVCTISLAACGSSHELKVREGNATFAVTVPDNELAVTDAELTTYVQHGANAVICYFGKFPLDQVNINIRAVDGNHVRFGRSSPVN